MKNPAISAVIPTRNRAHLIARAIESVLSQADPDDELIVIDDGSEDDTSSVVAKYGSRIKYIYMPHRGAGVARNRGVREATRPLVAFLDSDDAWMPEHNQLLKAMMSARTDLLFCFSNYAARFEDTSVRHFALESHHGYKLDWEEIMGPASSASTFINLPQGIKDFPCYEGNNLYRSLCSNSFVCVNTLIVRRIDAGDNLWFAEDTPTAEEWECGARLARAGKSMYLHCETAWIYHHQGKRLTDADMFEYASSRILFRKRIWGADPEFLKDNKALYEKLLRDEQVLQLEGFLLQGRTREARKELSNLKGLPTSYTLLAHLPGIITKKLLDIRRAFKSLNVVK